MNDATALTLVRRCLAAIKPQLNINDIADNTELLEERVITSFDTLDLIIQLEEVSGREIRPDQLVGGSFRDIKTIARVFLHEESDR